MSDNTLPFGQEVSSEYILKQMKLEAQREVLELALNKIARIGSDYLNNNNDDACRVCGEIIESIKYMQTNLEKYI
tara:strand:- start:3080 stop:3304 length:225 start_codon:yes stop_codon:yes gene_type:complete